MSDLITIENAMITKKGIERKTTKSGKDYAEFTIMWSSYRKDQSGNGENGPTKFVRVRVGGFEAENLLAAVGAGDRVNVTGRIEHFEWSSQQGVQDDWGMWWASVSLPVPRAQQGQQQGGFQGQQQGNRGGFGGQEYPQGPQKINDPWNSAPPAGGFGGADDNPPF